MLQCKLFILPAVKLVLMQMDGPMLSKVKASSILLISAISITKQTIFISPQHFGCFFNHVSSQSGYKTTYNHKSSELVSAQK